MFAVLLIELVCFALAFDYGVGAIALGRPRTLALMAFLGAVILLVGSMLAVRCRSAAISFPHINRGQECRLEKVTR
jgi:hypothetical protein